MASRPRSAGPFRVTPLQAASKPKQSGWRAHEKKCKKYLSNSENANILISNENELTDKSSFSAQVHCFDILIIWRLT
jgi:hypothetical protein